MTTFTIDCPLPIRDRDRVTLAHGGGGSIMHRLLEEVLLPAFDNPLLGARHDGAVFDVGNARLAFTTDSYVVSPLFFPGGDIGTLAVNGTVNDLAMCGARPLYLSCGLIIEEGFEIATLKRVIESMARAAREAGVHFVTGDTKVVDRGKGDGIFVNTAGVGVIEKAVTISPNAVRERDVIVLSGDVGRHGIAIMAVRQGLEFETPIESDCAPVASVVHSLLNAGIDVHCLRDLTRGGLATTLVEIAGSSHHGIEIDEPSIAVTEAVAGACEMLGFDPLYLANEGRFIAFVAEEDAARTVEIMRRHEVASGAAIIGRVVTDARGQVQMRTRIGTRRVIDMLSGEQLPRIC